jgi:hypothetical protein
MSMLAAVSEQGVRDFGGVATRASGLRQARGLSGCRPREPQDAP